MDQLQDAAWRHAVGLVRAEDLPMIAAYALADGADSPSLRELAGLSERDDTREIGELFVRTFAERNRAVPDRALGERLLLRHLAAELLAGVLTPTQVAFGVGDDSVVEHLRGEGHRATADEIAFLNTALSCTDYWEEYAPDAFRDWQDELRETATRLVGLPADVLATLHALLAGATPVARGLRAQIAYARIVGRCACGCATVDLAVDRDAAAPAPAHVNPAAEAGYASRDDAGVLLFTEEGYLSRLEIYTAADEPVAAWPEPSFDKR